MRGAPRAVSARARRDLVVRLSRTSGNPQRRIGSSFRGVNHHTEIGYTKILVCATSWKLALIGETAGSVPRDPGRGGSWGGGGLSKSRGRGALIPSSGGS